jgi:hypothetical protein
MNKFESFAIILDAEPKKRANYFKRLVNALGKKLGKTVKHRPGTIAARNLLKMYRAVQESNVYENTLLVRNNSFEFDLLKETQRRFTSEVKQYQLMKHFEELVELLAGVCEEPRGREIEIEFEIEVPKPKKLRKVTTYEKITILERWVKIGFKMYRRHLDVWTGDEYIVVDGDIFYIKQNRYGQEYLA